MRTLGLVLVFALLCLASAQSWLEDFGELTVLSYATNPQGTEFVEVPGWVSGVSKLLPEAMNRHGTGHIVLLDSEWAHVGYWVNGNPTHRRYRWHAFFAATKDWDGLSLEGLEFELADGPRLNPDSIAATLAAHAAVRPTVARPASASLPRNGCVSSTTSTSSSTRCYTDGRLTYQVVCTSNPRTFEVSCRSDSY